MRKKPFILAPAGDFMSLRAALQAGCDEVYLGLEGFNMRANAKNFTLKEVADVAGLCHEKQVKAYVTLNTIIYENEIGHIADIVRSIQQTNVDAVIAWDMAVITACDKLGMDVHLSTQASVSNSAALTFYRQSISSLKRIILARECSLGDIQAIINQHPGVEVEAFVHGAMCVSLSGRCFLSQEVFGRSANRGDCLQPCRREYLIKDSEEGHEFVLGQDYMLSARDMCAMPFIEKLIDAGIDSFKIEGRNRSGEYVSTVVSAYRRVVDYYIARQEDIKNTSQGRHAFETLKKQLLTELKKVYNRKFSAGFFMGKPVNQWSNSYGSQATTKKIYVGKVLNFYQKINVAKIKLETGTICKGDSVMFQGPTTGVLEQKLEQMQINSQNVNEAVKGNIVGIKTLQKVRRNDKLYKIEKVK